MNTYPNLTSYGYKIEGELGRNREGGRITWQGIEINRQKPVVIKQFCFAIAGSSWSGYKAYEKEIKVLQQLKHPSIPQCLDSIETEDGFCLIQEYIPASNLNNFPNLTLPEVKEIVLKILDILIYLQQHHPPILHRDLKPENILLDKSRKVYLIDFGFASLGSKEVSGSSVFKGTPGFVAPEQIIKPTPASDIYSLGVTIVCLLANKSIADIRNLASEDTPYQLALKPLLPQLNRQFINWLKKMTNPKASQRFPDALAARNALISIDLTPDLSNKIVATDSSQFNILIQPQIIGGIVGISGLSTITLWGLKYASGLMNPTVINWAIAIIATVVITIAELGAAEIAKSDHQAKFQGVALGIIIPTLLVSLGGFIWGRGEAVGIAAAIAIAEIFTLSYYWLQSPCWKMASLSLRGGILFSAIALGIALGLNFI